MKNFYFKILLVSISVYISLILISSILSFTEYKKYVYLNKTIYDYCKKTKLYCEKKNLKYFFLDEKTKNPSLSIYSPPIHSLRIDKFINEKIYPLSGKSFSKTLICNEIGDYVFIDSDRYGFNNKDSNWNNNVDVLLVGDSYAFGECVQFKYSIANNLIKSNYSSISLGYGSNGPLATLGTIREYGSIIKPKKVFWIFFSGNDLEDLDREKKIKILNKYLNFNFSQNLINKQKNIDKIYSEYFDQEYRRLKNSWPYKFSLIKIFNLSILKEFINNYFLITKIKISEKNDKKDVIDIINNYDYEVFSKIINLAKKEVESWGGDLIFLYVPSPINFQNGVLDFENEYLKNKIFKLIKEKNLHFIDIGEKIMNSKLTSNEIYALGYGHFTKKGYKIVSTEIIEHLEKN